MQPKNKRDYRESGVRGTGISLPMTPQWLRQQMILLVMVTAKWRSYRFLLQCHVYLFLFDFDKMEHNMKNDNEQ